MSDSQKITTSISILVVLVALGLLGVRGGAIALIALLVGTGLLVKIRFKPSANDMRLCLITAVVFAVAWIGTYSYVISTWESGEVVELAIDTEEAVHTARLWVMDVDDREIVYYDAQPVAAKSLLAGKPLQFTRGGEVTTRIPKARLVNDVPEDEAGLVLETMGTKYGDRNKAATIYYIMIGSPHDRISLVVDL